MWSARPSVAPSVCPTVSRTSDGSRTGARLTQNTPALNSATSSEAASIESRVLPDPPGPLSVTSRCPRTSSATSAVSRSRPTNEDAGRGRFVLEIVLRGGKRSSPSWKIATGPAKSFSRCSPRSVTPPSSNARVAARQQHLPTVPRGRDPRTEMDVLADVTLPRQKRLAGVQPHSDPDQTRLEPDIRRGRSGDRRPRIGERVEERITLRVHLDTALGGEDLAKHSPMLCQRLRVRLRPELVQQPRRPLDVREQEGDGRAREPAAHARMIAARGSLVHSQPLPTEATAARGTSSAMHGPTSGRLTGRTLVD